MNQTVDILIKLLRAEIDENYVLPELSLSSETIKTMANNFKKL